MAGSGHYPLPNTISIAGKRMLERGCCVVGITRPAAHPTKVNFLLRKAGWLCLHGTVRLISAGRVVVIDERAF
jgi:hypothetical protein